MTVDDYSSQLSHVSLLPYPGTGEVRIMLGTSRGILEAGKNFIIASDLFPVQNRFVQQGLRNAYGLGMAPILPLPFLSFQY